jgi:hypothetical protein
MEEEDEVDKLWIKEEQKLVEHWKGDIAKLAGVDEVDDENWRSWPNGGNVNWRS